MNLPLPFRSGLCLLLLSAAAIAESPKPDRVLKLWEGKPPGDFTAPGPETVTAPKPGETNSILRLTNVTEPRLEFYLPAGEKKNGAAVIIVPGGGFGILASEHEGSELAIWLRDRGFVGAVLQHRCPTNTLPKPAELPAQDTQRAVSLLRSRAAEFGVKPDRVGLFGFSAGGQVALIATTNAAQRLYPAADGVDAVSCRPDFLMLCYPWKILAENSTTELRPEIKIDATTPPTFLAQAYDDPGSLAEGSTLAFLALRKARVPAELHIYTTGGHGFGMRPNATQAPGDWPGRLGALAKGARTPDGLLSTMAYLWITLGGAAGSALRYFLAGLVGHWLGHAFLGTMFVNVAGSFTIGLIAALGPIAVWEQLLMIGMMGGFTTFSSFSLQTLQLIHEGRWTVAFSNVTGSIVLCLFAVWLGHLAGSALRR